MDKYVIIVAGGKGLRMGADLPKQFIPVAGKPLLMHTLEAFYQWDSSAHIVLVLPEDHQSYWKMLCEEIGCEVPHRIVTGGATRFNSVKNGLDSILFERNQIKGNVPCFVAVHDGVRPFVSSEVIQACFERAVIKGAVIPVIPMIDSLRKKEENGETHPVDRTLYIAVQTPQVFDLAILAKSYEQSDSSLFTDDASVVESMGYMVDTVIGDRKNIKITTPFDLLIAEAIFAHDIF